MSEVISTADIAAGMRFGRWLVLSRADQNRWLCRCECGTEKPVWSTHLAGDKTRSCPKCASIPRGLEGQRFGKLTAVRLVPSGSGGMAWACRCDCGREVNVPAGALRYRVRSCGCSRPRRDLSIGERFGHLVVAGLAFTDGRGTKWRCLCDCGREVVVAISHLSGGHTQSCGCIKRRHGHWDGGHPSPTYASWSAMWERCTRKKHPAFHHYGGRGITVCERWSDFVAFLEDMGERPSEAYSLDRIDNDRGYEPGNVRWATSAEQARNRRDTRRITALGRTMPLVDWAAEIGVRPSTIRERLRRGWPADQAVSLTTGAKRLCARTAGGLQ